MAAAKLGGRLLATAVDGAMNELQAVRNMNPQVPVLFIAPRGDYPPLRSSKQMMFTALPANPLTKLYEPDASHLEAPSASTETHP